MYGSFWSNERFTVSLTPASLTRAFDPGEPVRFDEFISHEVMRNRQGKRREVLDGTVPLSSTARRKRRSLHERSVTKAHGLPLPIEWDSESGSEVMKLQRSTLDDAHVKKLHVGTLESKEGSRRWLFCKVNSVGEGVLEELGSSISLGDYSVRDRERWLQRGDVLRWLVVRDPWSRVVQFWMNGVKNSLNSSEYRRFMSTVRGRRLRENEHEVQKVSLLMYLMSLARQPQSSMGDDVSPITQLCAFYRINYTSIVRWEQAQDDLEAVERQLGRKLPELRKGINAEQDRWRREKKVLSRMDLRRSQLRTTKVYKDDIGAFNYTPRGTTVIQFD